MTMYRPASKGRAAVYCRRSHSDVGVSLSVTTQAINGRRHGELLGYTVSDADIHTDDGISGMTEDRPAFRALMLKLLSPEKPCNALIVTDISRLSRAAGQYINHEGNLAEAGIELISLIDPPGNPELKFNSNRRSRAVRNEEEISLTALKTRSSQRLCVEMGFYIGWVAPFGYRKIKVMWNGAEHTKLERDPEAWPHLLHMIKMALDNYSLSQIIQYTVETGLKHPAGEINQKRDGKAGNGKWTSDNTAYLLKNRTLLGWTFRGGENANSLLLNKLEEVICRDAHPAAMTEDDREKIIANLASRTKGTKHARSHGSPNPLSGILVCEMCGANFTLHTANGTPRLMCANHRNYKNDHPNWCPNPAVRLDIFIERILHTISRHILTEKAVRKLIRTVVKFNEEFVEIQLSRKKEIKKRIKQLEKEIGNFKSAVAAYGPENPTWGREVDQRDEETELLQMQLDTIDSELEKKLVFLNDRERIVENAQSLCTYLESEDRHEVGQVLKSLIRKASILNRVVTVDYALPLPKNGTEEPILSERISLDKKISCLSVGHAVVLEGLPGLARRQSGRGAQPADAALPPVLGLLLQHFQEGLQGVAVPGGGESGHRLRPHGGQPELVAQLPDPDLNGVGLHHQATPASRES